MAAHLEAISHGTLTEDGKSPRLLMNVPPGMMKSLMVSVFYPAWEWGPRNMPHMRFVCASHNLDNAVRDSVRMRRLIMSEWYQSFWGGHVQLTDDQNVKTKFENSRGGFRQAVAAKSITGARGDRVIIDDPLSADDANSEEIRRGVNEWFLEAVPTRLNSPELSAIIVIMQRLHQDDVSGVILDKGLDYKHVMLPMEFEPDRCCETGVLWHPQWSDGPELFVDPRSEPGELLFPERFTPQVVRRDKATMTSYAVAGQFQQSPVPRGGGIIKQAWWKNWDEAAMVANGLPVGSYPQFSYVIASIDTAYTIKEENDPSACTIWGVWTDAYGVRRFMLAAAWADRLELHELVERVAQTCKEFRVSRILIEAKASGQSVAQELRRRYLTLRDRLGRDRNTSSHADFSVQLINPGSQDKIARLHSVVNLFEAGMVYAPVRDWVEPVIQQCEQGSRAKHDDLADTVSQALSYLRTIGLAELPDERGEDDDYRPFRQGNGMGDDFWRSITG